MNKKDLLQSSKKISNSPSQIQWASIVDFPALIHKNAHLYTYIVALNDNGAKKKNFKMTTKAEFVIQKKSTLVHNIHSSWCTNPDLLEIDEDLLSYSKIQVCSRYLLCITYSIIKIKNLKSCVHGAHFLKYLVYFEFVKIWSRYPMSIIKRLYFMEIISYYKARIWALKVFSI